MLNELYNSFPAKLLFPSQLFGTQKILHREITVVRTSLYTTGFSISALFPLTQTCIFVRHLAQMKD